MKKTAFNWKAVLLCVLFLPAAASAASERKSPVLSCVLSWILPGVALGQYYNEQPVKGAIVNCAMGAGIYFALVSGTTLKKDRGSEKAAAWLIGGACVFSIIDAPLSSILSNRRLKKMEAPKGLSWDLGARETASGGVIPFGSLILKL